MSNIDYEELIRSPLDELDGREPWPHWPLLLGLLIGAVAGLLLGAGSGESDEVVAPGSTTTSSVIPQTTVPISVDYPPGFVEIAPDLAVLPREIVVEDDLITVGFTTAVRRGSDPAATAWPLGGAWTLESSGGTIVESTSVALGRFSPGAFAVQFPVDSFGGETEFVAIDMVERWDAEYFDGTFEVPFDGEPFAVAETLSIPVSQDVTLLLPKLELGRFLGSVGWEATGSELGVTTRLSAVLLDSEGERIGAYERFPENLDPSDAGAMEIFWSEPFPTDQEGAVTVAVAYTVGVVGEIPAPVTIPLEGVPVGR